MSEKSGVRRWFETWAQGPTPNITLDLEQYGGGDYVSPDTEVAWRAVQALIETEIVGGSLEELRCEADSAEDAWDEARRRLEDAELRTARLTAEVKAAG